jgi:glycopeptide antibiotics resistance protein
VHLLPLRDLAAQLAGDPGVAVAQIGGNLLAFAAFGALAPLRFRSLARLPVIIVLAAAGSLAVETLQYTLALGRVSSVDAVLLNATGVGVAGLVTRRCGGKRSAGHARVVSCLDSDATADRV